MKQLFFSSPSSTTLTVWYLIVTLITPAPVTFASKHSTDSMVYDDVIRDVPRQLRMAQNQSPRLLDLVRHTKSLSVTNRMQQLLREYKEGDDSFVSSLRNPKTEFEKNNLTGPNSYTSTRPPPTSYTSTTPPPTTTTAALSNLCRLHVAAIFDGMFHGELWALKLMDSWGKPQSGILEAHIRSYGDYFECKAIKGHQLTNGQNVTIRGKFCMATLSVLEDNTGSLDISLQEGICVPDVCSQDEVTLLLDEILDKYNVTDKLTEKKVVCHFEQSMDGLAIFGLTFVVVLALIAIAATVVDVKYPHVVPKPWVEEEKEERNGRASINSNHNHNHPHPSTDHVVSSVYQPLTPSQAQSSRLREKMSIQLLLCFSLKANFKKLVDTTGKEDAMTCIHGLRFITISWIIVGHTILLVSKRSENFVSYAKHTVPYFLYQFFLNCTFACDSFLCFSGILVCYNLMHTLKYFKGKMRWHLFYIYRYLRLTPAMAVVMLLYSTTFPYWYDGPIWEQAGLEPGRCRNTWWHNLLYINNFFHNQCMGWLWYLAVDTQLYAISPIFATLLYKRPRLGIYFLVIALIVSIFGTAYVAYDIQLTPSSFSVLTDNMKTLGDPMVEYYYASYCRLAPYIIGMLAGYLLYATDRKMNIPRIWQAIGWALVVPTSTLIVFGLYKATVFQTDLVPLTLTQAVMYNALSRPAWGAIVAWVIVICVTGHGGILNSMLSWKPLIPFARATYMAYMIHVIIILWFVLTSQRPIFMTDPLMFALFFGFIFMTYLIAFPATLLVEAPIMSLQRLLIDRHSKKEGSSGATGQDQGEG